MPMRWRLILSELPWAAKVPEAAWLLHWRLGEVQGALREFEKRLAIEESLESKVGRGRAHFGIWLCLSALGRIDDATGHRAKAEALYEDSDDHEYRAKLIVADANARTTGPSVPPERHQSPSAYRSTVAQSARASPLGRPRAAAVSSRQRLR